MQLKLTKPLWYSPGKESLLPVSCPMGWNVVGEVVAMSGVSLRAIGWCGTVL